VVLLALVCSVSSGGPRWNELDTSYTFQQYVSDFSKSYSDQNEHTARAALFQEKLQKILSHNADPDASWKMGVNHLSDRTPEEYKSLLGYKKSVSQLQVEERAQREATFEELIAFAESRQTKNPVQHADSSNIDWRTHGVVTAVKDQGNCGSCWSFATAETVESHWAIATGELSNLSEQQILDCTPNPKQCGGTGGCGGGTSEIAFQQIISGQHGLSSEWTYPYLSYGGQSFLCHFNKSLTEPVAVLKNYTVLPSNKLDPVMYALTNIGPLSIAVDANEWGDYAEGVFNGCNVTNPDIDHGVQLVGYGTDPVKGEDYWLVRNSWSAEWGENGYIRIGRPSTVTCGTDLHPGDGTGCKGGPKSVKVCGPCALLYDVSFPIVGESNSL